MRRPEDTRRTATSVAVIVLVTVAFYVAEHREGVIAREWFPLLVAGSYVLFFNGILAAWEKVVWPLLHPEAWIQGYWYMVNTHADGSTTEGVFQIVQAAERVEKLKGANTLAREDDPYLAESWSTSGRLLVGSEPYPDGVVFDYSYVVRRTYVDADGKVVVKAVHAHEELHAVVEEGQRHPSRLEGDFESGASYGPKTLERTVGRSVNTRINKAEFRRQMARHDAVRKQLFGSGTLPAAAEGKN